MKYSLWIKQTKIRNVLHIDTSLVFKRQKTIFYAFVLVLYFFLFPQRKSHYAFINIKLFVFIKSLLFERFIIIIY